MRARPGRSRMGARDEDDAAHADHIVPLGRRSYRACGRTHEGVSRRVRVVCNVRNHAGSDGGLGDGCRCGLGELCRSTETSHHGIGF